MKRILAILLTLSLTLSLAACGSKAETDMPQEPEVSQPQEQPDGSAEPDAAPETPAPGESAQEPQEDSGETEPDKEAETPSESKPEEKPAEAAKPGKPAEEKPTEEKPAEEKPAEEEKPAVSTESARAILASVWSSYSEEEKFPAADEPFSVDAADTDTLSYQLTFPADDASLIDDAAVLMHMMNMNTFTCGAFHASDAKDISRLTDDLRAAVQGKHWMCGFPEKLVIATVGQYVISMYGNEELINTFRDKLLASYSAAAVVYDEAITGAA